MSEVLSWIVGSLGTIGAFGSIGALVVVIFQWVFNKETKAAWKDLRESFVTLFANIPRRWNSEQQRMAEVTRKLLATNNTADDDSAALKAFATNGYAMVRVLSGIVEDVGNIIIKALIFVGPPVLALYRRFIFNKKNGK